MLLLDIKVEVQHWALWTIAFLRGTIVDPFTRPVVELCREAVAVVLRQVFHAVALGEILPDQAVGVFVGAAFPRMKLAALV
jgi:hypothetical protein